MGTPYRSKSNMDFGKGTNRAKNGPTLTEKQKPLDKNNNNKIDAQDFKMINDKPGAPNMKDGVYKQGFEKNGPTLKNDNKEKINDLESELFHLREDLKGGGVKQPPLIESGKRIKEIQALLKKLRA